MIREILGEQQADDIFFSSMLTGILNEKQAADMLECLEKNAALNWKAAIIGALKPIASALSGAAGHLYSAATKAPDAIGKLALIGAGTGVLGATAYDVVKENVSSDDPESELNAKIEAMYNGRKKELEDAKWMEKVRGMRDELKRNYKKMTTEEYESKYNKLMEALNERGA